MAGDVNKANPSKVRFQNGAIHKTKKELLEGWRNYFASLLNNRNANSNPKNNPEPSRPLKSIKTTRSREKKSIGRKKNLAEKSTRSRLCANYIIF